MGGTARSGPHRPNLRVPAVAVGFVAGINLRINLSASEDNLEQLGTPEDAWDPLRPIRTAELITRRSRVQIPPPLSRKARANAGVLRCRLAGSRAVQGPNRGLSSRTARARGGQRAVVCERWGCGSSCSPRSSSSRKRSGKPSRRGAGSPRADTRANARNSCAAAPASSRPMKGRRRLCPARLGCTAAPVAIRSVSKTVGGRQAPRGFESHPLRFVGPKSPESVDKPINR
jgi:hypothetical protein